MRPGSVRAAVVNAVQRDDGDAWLNYMDSPHGGIPTRQYLVALDRMEHAAKEDDVTMRLHEATRLNGFTPAERQPVMA